MDRNTASGKVDGYFNEKIQVEITMIGDPGWADGSASYPDGELRLTCCGAELYVVGSGGVISNSVTIDGPESPGTITKTIHVRKPPQKGGDPNQNNGNPNSNGPYPSEGGPGAQGMNGTNGLCYSCPIAAINYEPVIPVLRTGASSVIDLGVDDSGYSLGTIVFYKSTVADGLVSFDSFSVREAHEGTKTFIEGFKIKQVISEATIVTFEYPSAGNSVVLKAYDISAKGDAVNSAVPDGPFTILDDSTPLVIYTFSGLLADATDRLGISIKKQVTEQDLLVWELRAKDEVNLRKWWAKSWDGEETEGEESVLVTSTEPDRWERKLVVSKTKNGALISKEESNFVSWEYGELIASKIEGDGLRVTLYEHYDGLFEDGRLKSTVTGYMKDGDFHSSGEWRRYQYGDINYIYRPWVNSPALPAQATIQNSRVTAVDGAVTAELIEGKVVSTTTKIEDVSVALIVPGEGSVYFSGDSQETITPAGGYSWSGNFSRENGESLAITTDGTGNYQSEEEEGDWDSVTRIFTPVNGGSARRMWQGNVYREGGNFKFVENRSMRTVSIIVGSQVVYEVEEVFCDNQWARLSTAEFVYDIRGRRVEMRKDGDIVSSVDYLSDMARQETDERGVVRRFEKRFSSLGEVEIITVYGARNIPNVPDSPDIETKVVTSRNGLCSLRETTTTAGASTKSMSTRREVDLLGREVSLTDERGRVTTFSYSADHREIQKCVKGNMMLPGGDVEPVTTIETVTTHPDGQLKSVISNAAAPRHYSYMVNEAINTITTRIGDQEANPVRWSSYTVDGLGNIWRESKPGWNGGVLTATYGYDSMGRRNSINTPGLAAQLTVYNVYGEPYRRGQDADGSEELEEASADPLSEKVTLYVKDGANWWRETTTRTWVENGTGTTYNSSQRERLGIGANQEIVQTDRFLNTVTTAVSVNRAAQTVTTAADSSLSDMNAVEISVGGRVMSKTSFTNSDAVTYEYDDFGRVEKVHDPATGITTYSYNAFDQPLTVTDDNDKETTYAYYGSGHVNAGALWSVKDPTGKIVYYAYDALGRETYTWGATYPVRYEYNVNGQKVKMHTYLTFQDTVDGTVPAAFAADGDVTTWHYHGPTGLLLKKEYADGERTSYGYTPEGMPSTRGWARGVTTTYTHDNLGRLTGTAYSDATPDIDRTYDRAGRPLTVSGGPAGTRALSHAGSGSEEYDGGIFDGLTITNNLSSGRPSGRTLANGSTTLASNTLSYDSKGRVGSVSFLSAGQTINTTYGYHATHGRISSVTTGGLATITTSKVWDTVGRLESITTTGPASAVISGRTYQRDDAGRITRGTLPGESYWTHGYDGKGQVKSSGKRFANGTAVYGLGNGYVYDDIGNRLSTESTANLSGQQPIDSVYAPNGVNQYTGITQSTDTDGFSHRFVIGEAVSDAAVEVNGSAVSRQGDWFAATVKGDTSSGPAWAPVTVKATKAGAGAGGVDLTKSSAGGLYIPPSKEALGYDEDGNLTSDGRWTYTWDAENRLISMETNATAIQAGVPAKKVEYAYDGDSRRIRRAEPKWNSVTNQFQADPSPIYYVWKDWTLLAELKSVGGTLDVVRSYSWGLDLADSLDQTGNVGSLLAIVDESGSSAAALLPTYDGNGNIIALANAADATLVASYDYDAFGKQILRTNHVAQLAPSSDLAKAVDVNRWGFSSKQADQVNGLHYYGYRFYDAVTGRWLNRDPIGEDGGEGLYNFVKNNPNYNFDYLGNSSEPNSPSPYDNNTFNTEDGGSTNQTQWFEENYPSQVASAKEDLIKEFNKRIKNGCMGTKLWLGEWIKEGQANDTLWKGLSVGRFLFKVHKGTRPTWDGLKWSWEAEMVIEDTAGVNWGDSPTENGFVIVLGWNFMIPKTIYRASWAVKGEGRCCDDFVPTD